MPDRTAPAWDLEINKKPLPDDVRALIQAVSVKATVDGADELVIRAVAWSQREQRYRLIGESTFAPGNRVVVSMGYAADDLEVLQRFRLVRSEDSYPPTGPPRTVVRGYSPEYELAEHMTERQWPGTVTASQVAEDIAADHGLRATGDSIPGSSIEYADLLKPRGTSDWEFLRRLALTEGYGPPLVRYDADQRADVLYFRPQDLATQENRVLMVYNRTVAGGGMIPTNDEVELLSFSPTLSLAGVPTKVRVTGWSVELQTAYVVTAGLETGIADPVIFDGTPAEIASLEGGATLKVSVGEDGETESDADDLEEVAIYIESEADAIEFARAWVARRSAAYLVARGSLQGAPGVWVGEIHEVAGVADVHAGLWEIEAITHTITGSSFRSQFDATRVLVDEPSPAEL